jgi:uncharacterized protein
LENEKIITSVQRWVESVVVGLNLCPFAKREIVKNRVRYCVTDAITEEQLLSALQSELELLDGNPAIETTLLIHPLVLLDFFDYNQFLNVADKLLVQMKKEGVYQIASFHPNYQFGGTEPEDVENHTNKTPYPLLHLLREESLERAIADYPDHGQITERNIDLLKKIGKDKMAALLQSCFQGF